MEKKIGEVFYFGDKKLKVVPNSNNKCSDCFFMHARCENRDFRSSLGECMARYRTDGSYVKFQEVPSNGHSVKQIKFNFK